MIAINGSRQEGVSVFKMSSELDPDLDSHVQQGFLCKGVCLRAEEHRPGSVGIPG